MLHGDLSTRGAPHVRPSQGLHERPQPGRSAPQGVPPLLQGGPDHIAIINRTSDALRARWEKARAEEVLVATSSVVYFELSFGAYRSARPTENMSRIASVLSAPLAVLPFEKEDASVAGEVRAFLQTRGTPTGPYDTLIAGQALCLGLTLVTANTREFRWVRGLKLAGWQAA